MGTSSNATLAEIIYSNIDDNEYLNKLYSTILYNYSMKLFKEDYRSKPINLDDALRFADILSKSIGFPNSESHHVWAQEIIALLNAINPTNAKIKAYASSVLSQIGNYHGLDLINTRYKTASFLDELYKLCDMDQLAIPYQQNKYFFRPQKDIFDHMDDTCFSYSGPTSIGKSLLMRTFIKDKVINDYKGNFAILVPTKALITEISTTIQKEDLNGYLSSKKYKVVTNANSIFLKNKNTNFIFVLTPERLLYLLMSYQDLSIDYLFVDEAHKISKRDDRSTFYYKVFDMLIKRDRKPHIIFASPNIPNPDLFFDSLPDDGKIKPTFITTSFTPVSQIKFLIDLIGHKTSIYNSHSKKDPFIDLHATNMTTKEEAIKKIIEKDTRKSSLIYCNGRQSTVKMALDFANNMPDLNIPELDELSKKIKEQIHDSYYLSDLIKKGVAYHVGYLPIQLRTTIEDAFKNRIIKTLFCTSTLIEGVNLPADNLFILSYKNGNSNMSKIEFKNLIGRVGRIAFNLYGNVFIIRHNKQISPKTVEQLLEGNVEKQHVSIEHSLSEIEKQCIKNTLLSGYTAFSRLQNQEDDQYRFMRKIGLILAKDIQDNRHSVVFNQFNDLFSNDDLQTIKKSFQDKKAVLDDDINVSYDQTEALREAINNGLCYPPLNYKNEVEYQSLLNFLYKLSIIFKWNIYETKTIGSNKIRYYAVLIKDWINSKGIKTIIRNSIDYKLRNNDVITTADYGSIPYDDSIEHRNILIGETLSDIENVILFSIANYFLKFSTEYKHLITNGQPFENDWYEYVEFGSTNKLTITLQRAGISRDTSDFIRSNPKYYAEINGEYKIKKSIFECGNSDVVNELKTVKINAEELFVD